MEINIEYPKDAILKKYIRCYYEASIKNEHYIAFPNALIPTCLVQNGRIYYENDAVEIVKDENYDQKYYSINVYKKPVLIKFHGEFKTFNIIFKPYGFSQFLKDFSNYDANIVMDYSDFMFDFFQTNPNFNDKKYPEKISLIEDFFLSNYKPKKYTENIIECVEGMLENDIKELFFKEVSYKTMYRAFKNICGTSPNSLFQVIRLRNAIENMEKKSNEENLTEIAYALGFFDQAHFSNFFKELTQKQPKDFFKNISYISKEKILFEFI
ncbi:helix-turn-helix domain-containing protein [Aureivirga marina]|uniref:helix-turn-helix domain-containing protein n=1 Tax=Aureivirga marina TaxID=1182451 RepID=UPI0018C95223|nr:helix-turn-helix domain-containing protein [Aureivirga marina]